MADISMESAVWNLLARLGTPVRAPVVIICSEGKERLGLGLVAALVMQSIAFDLLVLNDTKVLPARVFGERATGPLVEARLHDADPQIDAVKIGCNEIDCHGQLSRYPVTCRPKPVIEGILRGFARSFIFFTFRSRRICAPTP